jgi:hypothetical protein
MTPGERLLNDNFNDDSMELSDVDDSSAEGEGKAYTLCMVSNPLETEDLFQNVKRNLESKGGKLKKIVVDSSAMGGSIKAVPGDENQAPLIGKIVFIKDADMEANEFEETMGSWVSNFNRKLAKYCIRKPRYSELRPFKYSLY